MFSGTFCGTEVIKTLIDQLAQGLQKWVGWQDGEECCLKGDKGIGKQCTCSTSGGSNCCSTGGSCHECSQCGKVTAPKKCYLSAYQGVYRSFVDNTVVTQAIVATWTRVSSDSTKVHLLARIFLGSVCLIWSGLSQLGFLTGKGSGSDNRWKNDTLSGVDKGLGSFMAAMGYDLDRLNHGGPGKGGEFVWKLLSGQAPSDDKNKIKWNEFKNGNPSSESVAEYYSSIYSTAEKTLSGQKTESICKQYPLLVLHILASGYFRAGSAGAKGVITPPKAALKKDDSDSAKKENTPRKPRTIREILYWLSALPYSEKYRELVERMGDKYPRNEKDPQKAADEIKLYDERAGPASTTLKKDHITHYLMAACGYCPLVLIGIQGTINTSGSDPTTSPGSSGSAAAKNRCPEHSKDRNKRCILEDANKAAPAPGASTGEPLKAGQVCYGGYHLAVKDFGPLHGMYANGLYGFDLGGSAAQCLDQLRVYVYHCFYQLYFLRKQCTVGVDTTGKTVLGWNSCRYGHGLKYTSSTWSCSTSSAGGTDCQCKDSATPSSPLMAFICDGISIMACNQTIGKGVHGYPAIETHWTTKDDNPPGHFGTEKLNYPKICPVPMGWSAESTSNPGTQQRENHFKDLNTGSHKTAPLSPPPQGQGTYPVHCTGRTLSHLLEYYCDPDKCHGTLVVLLRLLACITPTVPRTLGDLFGFYYYIVYIGGKQGGGGQKAVQEALGKFEEESKLYMMSIGGDAVVEALGKYGGDCKTGKEGNLKCLYKCDNSGKQCSPFLSPLSGQQYGQLSPLMAGTYLSWLVYLIGEFQEGLQSLESAFKNIQCKDEGCGTGGSGAGTGCGDGNGCTSGTHGDPCNASGGGGSGGANQGVCGCTSVVSCTGVLPVLYKYGFGYGNVETLHKTGSPGGAQKKCHDFLETLNSVKDSGEFKNLTTSINQLIYTTRLPWIFVLTLAWLVAVLYLAFGAIWPLDWTHMRSHCRGWFRKGSLSPWEILMVGKKKGRGILEFFGKEGKDVVGSTTGGYRWVKWLMVIIGTVAVFAGPLVAALVKNNDAWKIPLAVLLGIGGGALLVAVMVKAVVGAK